MKIFLILFLFFTPFILIAQSDSTGVRKNDSTIACTKSISSSDFMILKKKITDKKFETEKLTEAKQLITENCFTTSQVKEMVLIFTFEKNKLIVATNAWYHTTDRQFYSQLNDAFEFENSIAELEKLEKGN